MQVPEPIDPGLRELVQLEQQRIDRDNQRSNVMLKALELADAQDQRQFQYVSATRDAQMAHEESRLRFFRRFAWVAFAVFVTAGVGLFCLAFSATPSNASSWGRS